MPAGGQERNVGDGGRKSKGEGGTEKSMIELILSHWATYLFLVWVAFLLVGNLWATRKTGPPAASDRAPTPTAPEFGVKPLRRDS
jgi:hypothetical protein